MLGRVAHLAAQPAAPAPLGPPNGGNVTVPFNMTWSSTLNPANVSGGYNWQVSRSSSFSPLVLADSTSPATTRTSVSGLDARHLLLARPGSGQRHRAESRGPRPRSFTVTGAGPGTPGTPVLGADARIFDLSSVGVHPLRLVGRPGCGDLPPRSLERPELSAGHCARGRRSRSGTTTSRPTATATSTRSIGNWFARVFAVDADNPQDGRPQPALERDPVLRASTTTRSGRRHSCCRRWATRR